MSGWGKTFLDLTLSLSVLTRNFKIGDNIPPPLKKWGHFQKKWDITTDNNVKPKKNYGKHNLTLIFTSNYHNYIYECILTGPGHRPVIVKRAVIG